MRHSLQVKLLIVGIICVALTVGSSAVQIVQYRDIALRSDRIQSQYDLAIDDSSRLREEVIRLIARVKDVWLRGGKTDSVDSIAVIAEQSWQLIFELRSRLDTDVAFTPTMRDRLGDYDISIADYRQAYLQTLHQYVAELSMSDAANADTRADAALRGKGLAASMLLGGFQDEIHRETAAIRKARGESIATAQRATLIATALLLSFLTATGVWLVRSIGRGVGNVAVAAEAFGRGIRDVAVPVRGKGELARLGRSFNQMVRALDRQEQQLEDLRRIAVALTGATTEQQVCDIVVRRLAETFGYHYVSIYLLRPGDPGNLHLICQRGYTTVIDPIPVAGTVTGRSVRERQPILVADSRTDADFIAAEQQIVCEACAPILTPDRVLGTLLLEEETVSSLTEADLNLITTLANNLSVALENVRLNSEAQSRIASLASANRDLAAVTATGTRLASILDRNAAFRVVADEIGRVVDAPNLYVAAYHEATQTVSLQVGISGGVRMPNSTLSFDRSISGWLITHRAPLRLSTKPEVEAFLADNRITSVAEEPQSILGVPLVVGTRVVGAVAIGSPRAHAYNEQQVSVVQTIAAQAAIALNNALLYEQVQAQVVEMQRLNAELASANALKSEFLATMSHELRTPLNAIIGFSEILTDGVVTDADEITACLTDILNSGRHLLSLINDVLDISKIEAGHMEVKQTTFDIRSTLEDVRRAVAPLVAARRHTMVVDNPPGPVFAFADRQRIHQVVLNLVSNAIKFTPDGGTIHVGAAPLAGDATLARVWVEDTGIGIGSEDFPKLFEKFRQLESSNNRRYEGTGLGLALTKQLVEINGGTITVQSTVGVGSTFAFTLPMATAGNSADTPTATEPVLAR